MAVEGRFTSEDIRAFVSGPLYDPEIMRSRDVRYPRISVIVPSYNQARFLERTLLSILNQNYPNTEIIVMDGGSQDGSVELIRKYEPYLAYWVSEPDKGQPNALNRGFARATGELIGWQNSDDLYTPGFFDRVARSFRAYPKLRLFISNIYMIDENDQITWESRFAPFSVSHLIYLDWNLSSQGTLLDRRLAEQAGLFREDIQVGFDWDWFIRVGRIVKAKQTLLHGSYGGCYRVHSASKLSTQAQDARWRIEAQILCSHGIPVREELPYTRQPWWQARVLRLRARIFNVLLYRPIPWGQHLRPLLLRYLAKAGIFCEGFA